MATYAIGDVQGCYDALMRLLERVHFDAAQDRLWLVGDLVNRGPDSLSVLRFVKALGTRAVAVLGNHDLHLLALYYGERQPKRNDTLAAVLRAPDCAALLQWLRERPLMHRDPALGFVMTHAGVPPIWTFEKASALAREIETCLRSDDVAKFLISMYGNEPRGWHDDLTGMRRLRVITNYLTRMRVIDAEGKLNLSFKGSPAALPAGCRPWFEPYRARPPGAEIVFGHWAMLNGETNTPRIHALDTGCVYGQALTALRLEDRCRFSVPAVENEDRR